MGINGIRSLHANMENGTQTGSIYGVFVFWEGGVGGGGGIFHMYGSTCQSRQPVS